MDPADQNFQGAQGNQAFISVPEASAQNGFNPNDPRYTETYNSLQQMYPTFVAAPYYPYGMLPVSGPLRTNPDAHHDYTPPVYQSNESPIPPFTKKPKLGDDLSDAQHRLLPSAPPLLQIPSPALAMPSSSVGGVLHSAPIPRSAAAKDVCQFQVGETLEYFNPDATFYGFAWYSVVVVARGVKIIGPRKMPFYVIGWPDPQTTISVEEWKLRRAPQSPSMLEVNVILQAGTFVECYSALDATPGTSGPQLKTWFMAKLTSECKPGTKPQVTYLNQLWNQKKVSTAIDRASVRLVMKDAVTELAWRNRLPPTLLSDEEHLLNDMMQEAERIMNSLDMSIHTLNVESFEKERDRLCEIIDSLTNSRYYDKAITLLKFLQDFEHKLPS